MHTPIVCFCHRVVVESAYRVIAPCSDVNLPVPRVSHAYHHRSLARCPHAQICGEGKQAREIETVQRNLPKKNRGKDVALLRRKLFYSLDLFPSILFALSIRRTKISSTNNRVDIWTLQSGTQNRLTTCAILHIRAPSHPLTRVVSTFF